MAGIHKADQGKAILLCGNNLKPGQDLVVAGYAGLEGTVILAKEREETLLKHFAGPFVRQCQKYSEKLALSDAEFFKEQGAILCEPVSEGGIMTALWRVFDEYKLGFEIELRSIPILQETVEICEVFDLNPYRLKSGGCVILSAENGLDLVKDLHKKGINAVVIGKVTAGIKRQILNGEIRSFLDRPKPDELYKI